MQTSVLVQISLELWGAFFCLICTIISVADRKYDKHGSLIQRLALITQIVQLVSDVCAYLFRGKSGFLPYYMVRIANFCVFFANYVLIVVFTLYIAFLVRQKNGNVNRIWLYASIGTAGIGMVNLLLSSFTRHLYYFDEMNLYHRGPAFMSIIAIAAVGLVWLALALIRHRKAIGNQNFLALFSYIVLLLVTTVIQSRVYGISLTNHATTISVLLVYMVYQINRSARIAEREKEYATQQLHLANQQREITDTRVELMVSQIQPHFISNTLLTLQGLYHEDMETADRIMNSFIHYLQQNFSRLSERKPIPLEQEVEYTKNFTDIACTRWPDMQVEYDLQCTDFSLPAMTIQPLVENAIRHGLMPLESGGKVIVTTFETEADYCVRVEDNGVGYDPEHPEPQYRDNRKHIGLPNIRSRLEIMCGGFLEETSEPGKGTSITVHIPKKEEKK